MSVDSGLDRTSFEVHCPRCVVTFPVGTRSCVHCGGPTGKAHDVLGHAARVSADDPYGTGEGTGDHSGIAYGAPHQADYSNSPIEPQAESPFSVGDSGLGDEFEDEDQNEYEAFEGEAEEPTSLGRTLMKSLGGMIWILMLVGYSLIQNCGE